MSIYKYQPHTTPGPFGTRVGKAQTETYDLIEIAELDGWHYVHVPNGVTIPEQPPEIQWQAVQLDAAEIERLKAASPLYQMIGVEIQNRIRERYSADREAAFARLGASVALGMRELSEDERREFRAYNDYVEEVRQWGRAERAKFGL